MSNEKLLSRVTDCSMFRVGVGEGAFRVCIQNKILTAFSASVNAERRVKRYAVKSYETGKQR